MLKETLRADLTKAMKANDDVRKSVLRMMLSAISYGETSSKPEEPEAAVRQYRRKLSDALTLIREDDKRVALEAELKIVEEYLPKQASEEEVKGFIATLDLKQPFGMLMKLTKAKFPNSDGAQVRKYVEEAQRGNTSEVSHG
jgi:uncharacterized protein YqeY